MAGNAGRRLRHRESGTTSGTRRAPQANRRKIPTRGRSAGGMTRRQSSVWLARTSNDERPKALTEAASSCAQPTNRQKRLCTSPWPRRWFAPMRPANWHSASGGMVCRTTYMTLAWTGFTSAAKCFTKSSSGTQAGLLVDVQVRERRDRDPPGLGAGRPILPRPGRRPRCRPVRRRSACLSPGAVMICPPQEWPAADHFVLAG